MDRNVLIAIAAVVVVVVLLAIWLMRRRRAHLRQRFGPEYERSLHEHGSALAAERELETREQRVARLNIRPLTAADSRRFSESWLAIQRHFVDAPRRAVSEADQLVDEVMRTRGYPVAAFEQRAADISVDHPGVVENYRAARAIAERHRLGQSTTEDLRQALVHYRELFAELVGLHDRPLHRAARGT